MTNFKIIQRHFKWKQNNVTPFKWQEYNDKHNYSPICLKGVVARHFVFINEKRQRQMNVLFPLQYTQWPIDNLDN